MTVSVRTPSFKWRRLLQVIRQALRNFLLRPEMIYRWYLKYKLHVETPRGCPRAPWRNAVLRIRQEWEQAVQQVKALGLPRHYTLPKNWDSLAALACILERTGTDAYILDAGAMLFSVILPWLYLYGYRHLIGINLVFDQPVRRGPIQYEYGDITQSRFAVNTFDVITCLSVIEHDVNLPAFFREVARILKPAGLLIVSTDYYADPIQTRGQVVAGESYRDNVPIHIFHQEEIVRVLRLAQESGLELTGDLQLDCQEKPIRWEKYGLDYTFLTLTLQKVPPIHDKLGR